MFERFEMAKFVEMVGLSYIVETIKIMFLWLCGLSGLISSYDLIS